MKKIGTLHFSELVRVPSDAVASVTLVAATAAALDWPTSTNNTGNANMARIAAMTTLGVALAFVLHPSGTGAALTGSSIFSTGSSALSSNWGVIVPSGEIIFQILGGSTGFSIIAPLAGQVTIETWQR